MEEGPFKTCWCTLKRWKGDHVMRPLLFFGSIVAIIPIVTGCATAPTGPSAMVFPGSSKTFDQFRFDDGECRRYAASLLGGEEIAEAGVTSAIVGTAVGALAGAAIGGHKGAGVGAGVGLVVGSAVGAEASQHEAYKSQRHYDHSYIQCMYAKGHQVPASGVVVQKSAYQVVVPHSGTSSTHELRQSPVSHVSPSQNTPPPPPPGYPPPPNI